MVSQYLHSDDEMELTFTRWIHGRFVCVSALPACKCAVFVPSACREQKAALELELGKGSKLPCWELNRVLGKSTEGELPPRDVSRHRYLISVVTVLSSLSPVSSFFSLFFPILCCCLQNSRFH